MHALRVFLLVAVILVGTSDGLFIKKLVAKKAAVKAGFLADVKAAALKFKAGAALKKDAIVGSFKALGKAKLGIVAGIKAAKLKVLGGIAAVKLAKLAAIKAGKLAFVKTLAAAKLAPVIAEKLAVQTIFSKGGDAVNFLKGKNDGKSNNFLGDIFGLIGGALPFGGNNGAGNPFGSIFGDLLLGALSRGQDNNKQLDVGGILGGLSTLSALVPQPDKPTVNIQTYQVNPAPVETYAAPPPVVTSYGVPPSNSYSPPATSYGVPQY